MTETITVESGECSVPVHIYRKTNRPHQPAVLWIHGGGYILGSGSDEQGNVIDERARMIAHFCDCTVLSVDYRLAPENPFPAALNDCYATLNWMVANANELGIDIDRIAIGGVSAGGGIAAGLALMNRDRENLPLRLQMLQYPMIDNMHATISGTYENHPIWTRQTSLNAWEMYLNGEPGEQAPAYAAAARAEDLSGLPPTYLCVGAEDLFRDECINYARRLIEAGTPCELAVFPGMYHGGDAFVPEASVSRRMTRSYLAALDDALN